MKYKLFGFAVILAIGMAACDTASQEVEPVISPEGYPVATFTPTTQTVNEGDTVYFHITTDKSIDRAITFTFKQKGGTADSDDYTAFPAVLLPYTNSVDLMIITWQDFDFSATETLQGEIGVYSIADRYLLNPSTVNPTAVTLTMTNYIGQLTVDFSWAKSITLGGVAYSTTNNVDFDFWIADAEGFDPADVWLTAIDWAAATGSHPESYVFESLEDGTYYFLANVYSNAFAGSGANTTIPITAIFNRQGTTLVEYELTQTEADALDSELPGYVEDSLSDINMIIFKVTVAGDKYTIFDAHDVNLGTYKKSSTGKTPRLFLNK